MQVHIWLLCSSYGIMFALLSFLQEMGVLSDTIDTLGSCAAKGLPADRCWGKGTVALVAGVPFYVLVGLRHLHGKMTPLSHSDNHPRVTAP